MSERFSDEFSYPIRPAALLPACDELSRIETVLLWISLILVRILLDSLIEWGDKLQMFIR